MLRILEEYSHEEANTWTERDFLAIQRALQIYIESFISKIFKRLFDMDNHFYPNFSGKTNDNK